MVAIGTVPIGHTALFFLSILRKLVIKKRKYASPGKFTHINNINQSYLKTPD